MSILRRFTNLAHRSRVDRDIADELQSHLELRIESNIGSGMSPEEARREALLRFGNLTSTRERVAASDTTLGLAGLARDIRYASRQLRRSPGFALTAILTLALGIGANVIVFGVLNAMILHPLNIPEPDRLVELANSRAGDDNQSYPDFLDYQSRNSTFTDMAAYRMGAVGLSSQGSAQVTWNFEVSTNYFDMLGIRPQAGRFFHANDDHGPNSAPYIVLTDAFWHNRFNADPSIIGTTVDLNKHPYTVLGVAPKGFHGTELFFWPEFWMPIVNEEQVEGYNFLTKRSSHGIFAIGRLKPGVTTHQAQDNLNSVARQMKRENPTTDDTLFARLVKPGLIGDTLAGPAKTFLAALMGLALLVLTAACINLAGIFAARSADRSRELAIRLSIGSSRWRILRQLLTEAVLVSLAGGLLGTLIAVAMLRVLSHWQPISEYPIHVTVAADANTYILALLLSIAPGPFACAPGLADSGHRCAKKRAHLCQGSSANHSPRPASRNPDRSLCTSRYRIAGGGTWNEPLASCTLRLQSRRSHDRQIGPAHGGILERFCDTSAASHHRCCFANSGSRGCRNHQCSAPERWRQQLVGL
jgi:predicted permease